MAVRLQDYIPLEEGVSGWLFGVWEKYVDPLMPEMQAAAKRGDLDTIINRLRSLDLQSIAQELEPGLRNHVIASLTYGSMLSSGKGSLYENKSLPPVVDDVVDAYLDAFRAMIDNAVLTLPAIMVEKAEISPSQGLCHHSPYQHTSVWVEVLKGPLLSAADKLNAVVMGQAKSAIDVAANLNTSRLVSLGFLDAHMARGIDVYQISSMLDGRVCPVCRTMHGKTFSTAKAYDFTLALLQLKTPEEKKAFAPFPSQSKASIASLRAMTPEQLQDSGLHAPPYHPGCRCREVKIGTVPASQQLPVVKPSESGVPDIPLPDQQEVAALGSDTLSDAMQGAQSTLSKRLTAKEIKALDDIYNNKLVNQWVRACSGPGLVQKAETDFTFCTAFNPKKMGQLVKDGDNGIKKWELDDDLTVWRLAHGDFAKELIDDYASLKGSVIHDKGFTIWSDKLIDPGEPYVKLKVFAPKGTKAIKVADQYAFPSGTKFQIFDTKMGKDGMPTLYVKVLEDTADKALLPAAGSVNTFDKFVEGPEWGGFGEGKIAWTQPLPQWTSFTPSDIVKTGYQTADGYTEQVLDLFQLKTWQGSLDKLDNMAPVSGYESLPPVRVIKFDGHYVLMDGNHRAATLYAQGIDKIKANVLDLDDPVLRKKWLKEKGVKELGPPPSLMAKPKLDDIKTPGIVPAGTAEKALLKESLGDDFLSYDDLTYSRPKGKGSVPGEIMRDASGQEWVVKHVANTEIARNEVLAGKLYEAMGVEVPELRLVHGPEGKIWVASKWEDGFSLSAEKLMSSARVPGLYDNFVVDAWMSNWDLVGMDYDNIGFLNGRAFRIDIGGALRFRAQGGLKTAVDFGDDVVDLVKMRNPTVNANVAEVFKDITEAELRAGALKVQSLPDDTIRKIIMQYGPTDEALRKKLADQMIARKRFIEEAFPKASVPPPLNLSPEVPEAKSRVTQAEWKSIEDSRIVGYSMKTDADQIEGQDVLIHVELDAEGNKVVVATMKLRASAADKVQSLVEAGQKLDVAEPENMLAVRRALRDTDDKIKEFAVGYFKQLDTDGVIRDTDLKRLAAAADYYDKAKRLVYDLPSGKLQEEAFEALGKQFDYIRAANRYTYKANGVGHKPIWDFTETPKLYTPHTLSAYVPPPASKPSGFQWVKDSGVHYQQKRMNKGWAIPTGEQVPIHRGSRYVAEDGPLSLEWVPDDDGIYAFRHQLTVKVTGEGPEAVQKVFDAMDKLGVKSSRATATDKLHLYLKEMAYLDEDGFYKFHNRDFDSKPVSEQIDAMAKYFKTKYDLTDEKLAAYAEGSTQAYSQGLTIRERLDLQGPDWADFASRYRLTHDNTGDMSMPELVEAIMNSGGRMITTTEKRRKGIPFSGMSPIEDIKKGGAPYFFTRIKGMLEVVYPSRFVFKMNPLKRTTTISYDEDLYGRTTSTDFIHANRKVSLKELEEASSKMGNETIIKGGLSLYDDLDYVIVSTMQEKEKILQVFREHGLREWPDGRPLTDIVLTTSEARAAADTIFSKAIPSWAKEYPDHYINLKQNNAPDGFIKRALAALKKEAEAPVVSPVPVAGEIPAWAFGYEKYYKKYLPLKGEEGAKKVILSYQSQSEVYPSWLSMNWKDKYKGLKKDYGLHDSQIYNEYPEMVK